MFATIKQSLVLKPLTKMKEKGLSIGLLYLSLHNQLRKKIGVNKEICRKEFFTILGKHFLIPKNLRDATIKEMVLMHLIERKSVNTFLILDCDLRIEEDANRFYNTLEMF